MRPTLGNRPGCDYRRTRNGYSRWNADDLVKRDTLRESRGQVIHVMQSKLDRGRQNGVRPEQYRGEIPEDTGFDVVALWCYLVERAERTFPCNMDGMIDLFEAEFHDLPSSLDSSLRMEWNASGISDAPNGDDIKNIAAVSEFVEGYALYYSRQDESPDLGEPDDQRLDLGATLREYGDTMYRLGVEAGRRMPRL